jgi:hypothetical protein
VFQKEEDRMVDIIIERLIDDTKNKNSFWWGKKNAFSAFEYTHRSQVKDKISIVFKIFLTKQHFCKTRNDQPCDNFHMLKIYLEKDKKTTEIERIYNDIKIKELVEVIEDEHTTYDYYEFD